LLEADEIEIEKFFLYINRLAGKGPKLIFFLLDQNSGIQLTSLEKAFDRIQNKLCENATTIITKNSEKAEKFQPFRTLSKKPLFLIADLSWLDLKDEDEAKIKIVRGVFLSKGFINEPKKFFREKDGIVMVLFSGGRTALIEVQQELNKIKKSNVITVYVRRAIRQDLNIPFNS